MRSATPASWHALAGALLAVLAVPVLVLAPEAGVAGAALIAAGAGPYAQAFIA